VLVIDPSLPGYVDLRPRRLDEPPPARDVVGVVVGFEDAGDLEAALFGYLEIFFYRPPGVHDHRLTTVRHDVGRTTQILVQYLPEEHAEPPSTTRQLLDHPGKVLANPMGDPVELLVPGNREHPPQLNRRRKR
jgi:hypothetical protein